MQNFPISNLQKHHQAHALRQQAAAGAVDLPTIDPSDSAAIAALSPQQLRMVQTGIYTDARITPDDPDDTPAVIPSHWSPEKMREVQAQFPDNWREVCRSIANNP